MINERRSFSFPQQPSLGSRLLGFAVSALLLVFAAMFSLVALAVVAIGGTLFAGWLWWKTRKLRQQMKKMVEQAGQAQASTPPAEATVIDGEWVREGQPGDPGQQLLR